MVSAGYIASYPQGKHLTCKADIFREDAMPHGPHGALEGINRDTMNKWINRSSHFWAFSDFTLYVRWEALMQCEKLTQGPLRVCPPSEANSDKLRLARNRIGSGAYQDNWLEATVKFVSNYVWAFNFQKSTRLSMSFSFLNLFLLSQFGFAW